MKRSLFDDGKNSLSHFAFGFLSPSLPIIFPIFGLYQYNEEDQTNTSVDWMEFVVGWVVASILK